jgi:hypothetical protein
MSEYDGRTELAIENFELCRERSTTTNRNAGLATGISPLSKSIVVTAFRDFSVVSLAKGKMGNGEYLDRKMAER